jgi:hypothetical protein
MLSRAETYKNNAAECEREALRATAPVLKSKYQGVAQQWREMAEQAKNEPSQTEPARFAENRRSRMTYHPSCDMVEALQAQARFCDELACACLDQTHAEDFRRKADKYRAAAVLISSNE